MDKQYVSTMRLDPHVGAGIRSGDAGGCLVFESDGHRFYISSDGIQDYIVSGMIKELDDAVDVDVDFMVELGRMSRWLHDEMEQRRPAGGWRAG